MSEASHTMSQSICHYLSFGIHWVVWIKPLVIICGYTSLIQRNGNVFIQFENCFRRGVPLDPSRLAQIFWPVLLILRGKGVNCDR